MQVVISTGDKDIAQLVSSQISLVNTMTNENFDEAGVEKKFGVKPERIVDYLTLIGDTILSLALTTRAYAPGGVWEAARFEAGDGLEDWAVEGWALHADAVTGPGPAPGPADGNGPAR